MVLMYNTVSKERKKEHMKITEIMQPSDKFLTEEINKDNQSGYLTEDLIKIIRADAGQWSDPMSADDILAELD